jgi:hypothetical protein
MKFGRQLLILSKIEPSSKLKKSFDSHVKMPIDRYFEMAFILWSMNNTGAIIKQEIFDNLREICGYDVADKFQRSIALPLHDVQTKMRKNRIIGIDEWFQPTILYKYPCVTTEMSVCSWGRPTIQRHLEHVVDDWLEDENDAVRQHWERLFENYIGETLGRTGCQIYNEQEIKKIFDAKGKVCDFLLEEQESIVLVEVKCKLLTNRMPASNCPQTLKSRLKATVIKGINQLEEVEKSAKCHPQFKEKALYKIIVTSSELWLGKIDFLCMDIEKNINIFPYIFSADDLDNLCELVRIGRTSFNAFFRDFDERNCAPETSLYSPSFLLHRQEYKLEYIPKHLDEPYELIIDKINDHFK